jgi:hypothetical protein
MGVVCVGAHLVAYSALAAHRKRRGVAKAEDRALVSAAGDVVSARTMAAFASPSSGVGLLRQLGMSGSGNALRLFFVTGLAGVAAHVLWRLRLPVGIGQGRKRTAGQQQQEASGPGPRTLRCMAPSAVRSLRLL